MVVNSHSRFTAMARRGEYYEGGPSPWVPATILGIILLIATTPFRMTFDSPFAYRPSGFPPALIWIPVIAFLAIQFFGGSYRYDRLGRPGMMTATGYGGGLAAGGHGNSGIYPPGRGQYSNGYYDQYNGPYDKGLMSSFTDYGGFWMLILLGIWLFSMVGAGLTPAATAAMAPPRFGFPWSLFAPQPQYVVPWM